MKVEKIVSDKLPKGFRYAGVSCGIKQSQTNDIALVVSDEPCTIAGVYTQNVVRAASIGWNEAITPTDSGRGVVVNSGNANACTGKLGEDNNRLMAEWAAEKIGDGASSNQIAVLSTGVIGVQLPIDKVEVGIRNAASSLGPDESDYSQCIDGIRTTDKDRKYVFKTVEVGGESYRIAAMAKGAGMIGPRMATMLGVVTTDYPLSPTAAHGLLKKAVDGSFNCISVEGHTSTNDAVLLLSPPATANNEGNEIFGAALNEALVDLAKMIPADGEGATHLVDIQVTGAVDNVTADRVARVVASSNLVKTAITGADPNWGRIVSAIGILDIQLAPENIGLSINGHQVFAAGEPLEFDAKLVSQSIAENFETVLKIQLGTGDGNAAHWTSDLTVDYVRFNSEYTT